MQSVWGGVSITFYRWGYETERLRLEYSLKKNITQLPKELWIPQVPGKAQHELYVELLQAGWAQLPTEPIYPHSISHNTDAYANQVLWASCLLVIHKGNGNSCSWKDAYSWNKYQL